jgi:hypothetical protein
LGQPRAPRDWAGAPARRMPKAKLSSSLAHKSSSSSPVHRNSPFIDLDSSTDGAAAITNEKNIAVIKNQLFQPLKLIVPAFKFNCSDL